MTIKIGCSLLSAVALLATAAHAQTATDATAPQPPPAAAATPPTPVGATLAPNTNPSGVAHSPVTGFIPPPPDGKGQVIFFRPSGFAGMAVWFNVRENGTALGKLSNGAYFLQIADPGPHTYVGATENKNVLHLEVDSGETYYVRGSIQMGVLIGEANMAPSDQATFEKAFKKMHLAKPPEPETKPTTPSPGT